ADGDPEWTVDPHCRSTDEGWRLGRDIRGHHRMEAGPGTDFAYGAPRRADQFAEPDAVPRAARAGAAASQAQRPASGILPRSRSFQGNQRLAGASDRRRAADAGWPPARRMRDRKRYRRA